MEKDGHDIRQLLQLYVENRCTPGQYIEVMNALSKDASNRHLLEEIKTQFDASASNESISKEQSDRLRNILINKITPTPVISLRSKSWKRWMAAASVLLVVGLSIFFLIDRWQQKNDNIASRSNIGKEVTNDVLPGGNKAVLTLADGSSIVLDDAANGALAEQGNTKVVKINGKLSYKEAETKTNEIVYNTISTPRGGQYQVVLPDGTNVWLNAASTLFFPTSFSGSDRRVQVTGEAYFEVAKNASMPFIVSVEGAEVQVLGTHFNIMAYKDEPVVKTTLLEGSVKFVAGTITNTLKPGQQSQLKQGNVKVVNGVDVDEVIAWKNGLFHFENADMETVMRQISRWYDVEVTFKNKRGFDPLHVDIPMNNKLSDVLKALELSGGATFKIEGKNIFVIQ